METTSQAFERPFRPTELTDSTFTSFSLLSMANQLMSEDVVEEAGRNALSLVRGHDLTVVLMVMKDQAVLHDHTAPGPITVTVLSGHIEFSAATETETEPLRLKAGETAVCAAHLTHRVTALEASAFLLVIGGKTAK